MTAEVILQIIMGLSQALPELIALFSQATKGTTVSATEVQAVITKYGADQAVFTAAIAAAKAQGK